MAVLTWSGSYGFDLKLLDLSNLLYGDSYTRGSTIFSANYDSSGSTRDEFRGYGFTYDANGIPTGGTVTSYAGFSFGRKVGSIDGASIAVTALTAAASTFTTTDDVGVYSRALSGNDQITGGRYADKLQGFAGSDKLTGGQSADKLYGGTGADTFVFKSFKDSTLWASDTIFDFSTRQKDKIDLHTIDARTTHGGNQAFTFIGSQDFHGRAGELRTEKIAGGTFVYGDVNGDGEADLAIYLKGVSSLSKGYFTL